MPDRILLVRLGALGDLVHLMPALDALRRAKPDARITWVSEDRFAGLLRGHPQKILALVEDLPSRNVVQGVTCENLG